MAGFFFTVDEELDIINQLRRRDDQFDRLTQQARQAPEIATAVAQFGEAYPFLDPSVAMAFGQAGLAIDDPIVRELASLDATTRADGVVSSIGEVADPRQIRAEEAAARQEGEAGFSPFGAVKGLVRGTMGFAQGFYEGVAARPVTAVFSAAAQNLAGEDGPGNFVQDAMQNYETIGPSGFWRAAEEFVQREDVSWGSGWFPGGAIEAERQQAIQRLQLPGASGSPIGHHATPGRAVAQTIFRALQMGEYVDKAISEPGTNLYDLGTATLDLASNIWLDPSNLIGTFAGPGVKAARTFGGVAKVSRAQMALANHGLLPGIRKTVDVEKLVDAFRRSTRGQRIEQASIAHTNPEAIHRLWRGRLSWDDAIRLAEEQDPEEVSFLLYGEGGVFRRKAAPNPAPLGLSQLIPNVAARMGATPGQGFGGDLVAFGAGPAISRRFINSRLTHLMPSGGMPYRDAEAAGAWTRDMLANVKVPSEERAEFIARSVRAVGGLGEGGSNTEHPRDVLVDVIKRVERAVVDAGGDLERLGAHGRGRTSAAAQEALKAKSVMAGDDIDLLLAARESAGDPLEVDEILNGPLRGRVNDAANHTAVAIDVDDLDWTQAAQFRNGMWLPTGVPTFKGPLPPGQKPPRLFLNTAIGPGEFAADVPASHPTSPLRSRAVEANVVHRLLPQIANDNELYLRVTPETRTLLEGIGDGLNNFASGQWDAPWQTDDGGALLRGALDALRGGGDQLLHIDPHGEDGRKLFDHLAFMVARGDATLDELLPLFVKSDIGVPTRPIHLSEDGFRAFTNPDVVAKEMRNFGPLLTTLYDHYLGLSKAFAVDERGMNMPVTGAHALMHGDIEDFTPQVQLTSELAKEVAPGPSVAEMRQLRRETSNPMVRGVLNYGPADFAVEFLSDAMSTVVKPLQLLRFAYITRVVSEEQVRIATSGNASLTKHPLTYLAYAMADVGRLTGVVDLITRGKISPQTKDVMGALWSQGADIQRVMLSRFGSDLLMDGYKRTGAWDTLPIEAPGASEHWLRELLQLHTDEVARRVAQGRLDISDTLSADRDPARGLEPVMRDQLPLFGPGVEGSTDAYVGFAGPLYHGSPTRWAEEHRPARGHRSNQPNLYGNGLYSTPDAGTADNYTMSYRNGGADPDAPRPIYHLRFNPPSGPREPRKLNLDARIERDNDAAVELDSLLNDLQVKLAEHTTSADTLVAGGGYPPQVAEEVAAWAANTIGDHRAGLLASGVGSPVWTMEELIDHREALANAYVELTRMGDGGVARWRQELEYAQLDDLEFFIRNIDAFRDAIDRLDSVRTAVNVGQEDGRLMSELLMGDHPAHGGQFGQAYHILKDMERDAHAGSLPWLYGSSSDALGDWINGEWLNRTSGVDVMMHGDPFRAKDEVNVTHIWLEPGDLEVTNTQGERLNADRVFAGEFNYVDYGGDRALSVDDVDGQLARWLTEGNGYEELRLYASMSRQARVMTDGSIEGDRMLRKVIADIRERVNIKAGGVRDEATGMVSAGDAEILEIIATGKLGDIDLMRHGIGDPDMIPVLERLDALIAEGRAPAFVKANTQVIDGGGGGAKRWKANMDRALDHMARAIMQAPTDKLSRIPTFKQAYWRRLADLMPHMDETTARQVMTGRIDQVAMDLASDIDYLEGNVNLAGAASETGAALDIDTVREAYKTTARSLGVDVDDWEVVVPTGGANNAGLPLMDRRQLQARFDGLAAGGTFAGELTDLAEADAAAKAFAVKYTNDLLFNMANKSQLGDLLRVVVPYMDAYMEIGRTWTKLAAQTPQLPVKINRYVQGARGRDQDPSTGFFHTDPNTGEEVFTYPLLGGAFAKIAGLQGGAPEMIGRATGLNLFSATILPGIGPAVSIPLAKILPNKPSWDGVRELLLPFGDPLASGGFGALSPGWVRRIKTAFASADGDRLFTNSVMDVARVLNQGGDYDLSTLEGQAALLDDATARARWLFIVRGIAQFTAPTGPEVRWTVKDLEGRAWQYQALSEEYRRLTTETGDQRVAAEVMVRRFGPAFALLQQPKSTAINPRSVTEEGASWERDNGDLLDTYPAVAGLFAPDDGGSFDYSAYLRQFTEGDRKALNGEEMLLLSNNFLAGLAMDNARDIAEDIPPARRGQFLAYVRDGLRESYPGAFQRGLQAGSVDAATQISQLRAIVTDTRIGDTSTGHAVATYLLARDRALEAAASLGLTTLTSERAATVALELRRVAEQLATSDPQFGVIFTRVFSRELYDAPTDFDPSGFGGAPLALEGSAA